MRLIGLDYGEKTIGVAISDPFGQMAMGHTILRREREEALKDSLEQLSAIVAEYQPECIVLGYPKQLSGAEGEKCEKVRLFGDKLLKRLSSAGQVPELVLWDERFSTVGATRGLSDINTREQRKVVDKMAAAFILQGYLDYLAKQTKTKPREYSMNEDNESAIVEMTDEDGNSQVFTILDKTEYNGKSYLLVAEGEFDEDDEDTEVVIFEQLAESDEQVKYSVVEDDEIIDALSEIFELDVVE